MDYGHPIGAFVLSIPNILADGADRPNKFRGMYLKVFWVVLTGQILSLH